MGKRDLPKLVPVEGLDTLSFEIPKNALARWKPALNAAAGSDEEYTINLYDPIGRDDWGGFSSKKLSGLLRAAGDRPVVLNLNSPGGDVFEGIAMYNLLRNHPQQITARVIGLAASAASIVMAGADRVEIGRASFVMVHNVWAVIIGNRNDLRSFADTLEAFDDALAGVYAALTGKDKKKMAKMMDAETWMSGEQAVAEGFANELLPADTITEEEKPTEEKGAEALARSINLALLKGGVRREERASLMNQLRATLTASPQQPVKEPSMQQQPTQPAAPAAPAAAAPAVTTQPAAPAAPAAAAPAAPSSDAIAQAIQADRERGDAIMALDETKGRETLAKHLVKTGASVTDAKATLAASPKANSLSAAMERFSAGVSQQEPGQGEQPEPLATSVEVYDFYHKQFNPKK